MKSKYSRTSNILQYIVFVTNRSFVLRIKRGMDTTSLTMRFLPHHVHRTATSGLIMP